jgi:hypothetical protein
VIIGVIACSHPQAFAPPRHESAPAVVRSYYRAVARQDYRLAFAFLAANATGPDGQRLSLPAFVTLARMMEGLAGPVTSFSVAVFPSLVVVTIIRKRSGPYHTHLRLTREAASWRIASLDRV